ncbi:putative myb-like dna-binding domain-containing protein [Erysiphe necator]|uniref:Putative myb-like dna-binding domain-containing protein n=1 Tax=Uncinula necator TaxID=52586 RepID=A0A0B1NYD0_UNCNE|nr:putative myb-like dna-binding domain-containing protein [Erysiphe necator]
MNVRAFRSRYQQGYDSKESLQSSKELSPGRYNDIGDNFRGGTNRERRRSNPDTRTNQLTSNTKRELFRESLCRDLSRDFSREPPRGPKGVPDAPTGPRASSYGDFRSDFSFRGDIRSERGRGRSHGWRDDSRDRGWDPERDYRDRRDERFSTTFRDDRSRDRWGSRDTYSSSRRPLSPQGRGRSPSYSQRDIREPAISDLERTKRVSRDSSLSTGFLSSDIIQPFARTFGKVRGARGRARTGNYDEYHRITGPNRSPADTGWNRRTQPSATPPPPVPAFGSTSNSIPIGTYSSTGIVATLNGSAASIAVPTAPRSERRHNKITTPTSTQTFSEISRRNGVDKQLGNPTSSVNLTSSTSPSISKFDQNKSDYEITKKGEKEISLVQDSNRSSHLISDKILASTHEAFSHHLAARSNTSSHKRHPIIAKGPPVKLDTLLEDAGNTSDSDSGDDFGDEYFEKEISRVKEEISKISLVNPLLPRCEPEVLFLNAFIESDIWNIIETTEFSTLNKCQESKLEKEIQDETSKLLTAVNSVKSKAQIKGLKPNLVTTLELPSAKLLAPENFSPNTTFEYQNKKIELVPATLSHNSNSSEKHSIKDLELHVHRPKRSATKQLDSSTDDLSDAENAAILESVRKRMKTPPITSLPRFKYKPWYEDEVFLKSLEPSALIGVRIYHHLAEVTSQKKRDQEKEKRRWASRYYRYRRFTDRSNDPAAIRSRERFLKSQAKSAAEATAPKSVLASANSKPEGSRRVGSRFATEHELQRVLLQSEKEAKESKDKQDRITRECTATAKEAIIPDMLWDDKEREAIHFEDRSGLISFERSFAILEFGEPIDNFTKEESSLFEKAYFEFPKQWGKIAETLPTRDYKSCIQHYYLVKHPSSLKKKLKDQSKKRKGRQSKVKKEKIVPLINDLSSIRDEEEIPDGEADARSRRPRRAAAPTFNSDLKDQQNEFEATNLALSLAKKPSGNSSSEQNTETLSDPASHSFPSSPHSLPVPLQPSLPIVTATKRKAKISRDKPTKQVKSSQSSVAPPEYQKADSPVTTLSQEYKMQQKSEISSKDCTETENLILKPDSNISYVTPVEQATSLIATNTSNFEKNQPVKTPEMTKISITSKSEPSLTQKNAQQTSSYWSVQEQDIFSTLLGYYGTNWHAISKYMATKTHIMVKNHYQRQVDSGKMKEWEIIAKAADEKLKKGEPTGPIPSPAAMPTRKRIEIPSTSLTRSSYPTDVDEDILNPLPISSSHVIISSLQLNHLHSQ